MHAYVKIFIKVLHGGLHVIIFYSLLTIVLSIDLRDILLFPLVRSLLSILNRGLHWV